MMTVQDRLKGCMMGLMCGDALGAPLEFKWPAELHEKYPDGVTGMVQGWNSTAARQPGEITDDSEMAIALLASLVREQAFVPEKVRESYRDWLSSGPSDVGNTIYSALKFGYLSQGSQANGALMRVAPLAMFAATRPDMDWESAARQDAQLTHVNPKCADANVIYVGALLDTLHGLSPRQVYELARARARGNESLSARLEAAGDSEPEYYPQAGWLEIALQCSFYWLLHARDFEQAMLCIVNQLGDPDTNGAIAGALLGARFGYGGIPAVWVDTVLGCPCRRPERFLAKTGMHLLAQIC